MRAERQVIRWGQQGGGARRTELHPAEIAPAHGEVQEDAIFYRPKQTAPFVMENITKNLSALTKYLWQAGGHWWPLHHCGLEFKMMLCTCQEDPVVWFVDPEKG